MELFDSVDGGFLGGGGGLLCGCSVDCALRSVVLCWVDAVEVMWIVYLRTLRTMEARNFLGGAIGTRVR